MFFVTMYEFFVLIVFYPLWLLFAASTGLLIASENLMKIHQPNTFALPNLMQG
jgi:hypothetical protein